MVMLAKMALFICSPLCIAFDDHFLRLIWALVTDSEHSVTLRTFILQTCNFVVLTSYVSTGTLCCALAARSDGYRTCLRTTVLRYTYPVQYTVPPVRWKRRRPSRRPPPALACENRNWVCWWTSVSSHCVNIWDKSKTPQSFQDSVWSGNIAGELLLKVCFCCWSDCCRFVVDARPRRVLFGSSDTEHNLLTRTSGLFNRSNLLNLSISMCFMFPSNNISETIFITETLVIYLSF